MKYRATFLIRVQIIVKSASESLINDGRGENGARLLISENEGQDAEGLLARIQSCFIRDCTAEYTLGAYFTNAFLNASKCPGPPYI